MYICPCYRWISFANKNWTVVTKCRHATCWLLWPVASKIKFAKEFIMKHYGGPQLSRQKQITHGKSKSLTAKANRSWQKQFYPAEYTCLVWCVYFYRQFYSLPKNFWFRHAVANIQCNTDIDQKPVSTIFIRNLENKSPRSCVRVNRCPSVKSTNTSIKAEQTDLR